MTSMRACLAAAILAGPQAIACGRGGDRLPPIPLEKYTGAQKVAVRELLTDRQRPIFGPFVPLLRSPDLMLAAKSMGDSLRFKSVLPERITEMTILVVCREWTQQVEWQMHYPLATKAGLRREIAEAIADGRRPSEMAADEQAAYDLSTELLRNKRVSDETYRRALAVFGEQGVVELLGLNGYYVFLAAVMNGARTAPRDPALEPLHRFPD
jgi:4-carboxymuconolactone decarboxylase